MSEIACLEISFSLNLQLRMPSDNMIWYEWTGASIRFSDGGGGGISAPHAKSHHKTLRAERAANWKLCMFSSIFMLNFFRAWQCFLNLFLHYIINFSSCRNYWGGGGGKRYVCPPIFSLGRLPPPHDRFTFIYDCVIFIR